MGILGLIASRNFIAVNKDLIKLFGLEEAIILGELASEHNYWEDQKQLDEDGYFFSTIENIEENTTIKEKRQRNALNNLKAKGIIDIKLKGLPAKRYIKIMDDQLMSILLNNSNQKGGYSSVKKAELDEPYRQGNNNIPNKNENKNNLIKDIISYLNEKLNSKYSYKTSKTQNLIQARLNENDYTLEDFKSVIDKKISEWKGSDMEKYLRPETLFGTKFEGYLNQAETKTKPKQETDVKLPDWINKNKY